METSSCTVSTRRYLLRHGVSKAPVAIVEASSSIQAKERADMLQRRGLLDSAVAMEPIELHISLPLPCFQHGYFALLERMKEM